MYYHKPVTVIITIDGIAASGKSSVASRVASKLNIPYISSGYLYRAVTYLVYVSQIDPSDQEAIVAALHTHPLTLIPKPEENEVWQGEENYTPFLHTTEVDLTVSEIARHAAVRTWVTEQLKDLPPPFVAEGRDMGTAVFPHAHHKFYLTASVQVRAQRRAKERPEDLESIQAALEMRDREDRIQSKPAPDAVVIDTSDLTLDQVVEQILKGVQ
ncbi:cytidylate kinase [Deinococcus cellulosilyticus NBRC 106333 = KACC 11606]|uniref:Cytidylate kinase n=1 Tax=Deinococcus cellulosilyticus (strain DSM 18568 / NBRC 106333 / KACC 11606 / 5516J-15) TaxID=1223518 RepID=A0A511N9L3_DEIC1|nr:cytidylate kinase [Deinococcus cellulosilyticus NBRC 106333 = KACC 11606]